ESTSGALTELKSLGVSLTVDDFGTGYSSLAYLKRFPVAELKIDRDFVAGLLSDQEDQAIVTAIINLAATLGVVAVAEGVENADQVRRLRELGCDFGQGYHFGRPLPPHALAARPRPGGRRGRGAPAGASLRPRPGGRPAPGRPAPPARSAPGRRSRTARGRRHRTARG